MGVGAVTKQPAVYILASKRIGMLYVGVISNLVTRVWEHKQNVVEGFTRTHHVHILVYVEHHEDMRQAVQREKQIKKWNRAWKTWLIKKTNLAWQDLWPSIY
jgi:putative endonuclease